MSGVEGTSLMGQPRAALGGEIAGELDLLAQRQHIREQPRAEQHLGLDVLRAAVRVGFGKDTAEAAQHLQIGGDDGVVKGHVMLSVFYCHCGASRKRWTRSLEIPGSLADARAPE